MKPQGILAVTITSVLALAGCNSSDDSSTESSTLPQTSTVEYRAIDGYLGNALVAVDYNANGVIDGGEEKGRTDSSGTITLSESDLNYDVIVQVIAGETTDSDLDGGLVSETRELVAKSGTQQITPFTTLAYLRGMDLESLANELNIDYEQITSDFVANSHHRAHALNRSLHQLLGASLADSNKIHETIFNNAIRIKEHLDSFDLDDDLVDVVVVIDADDNLSVSTPNVATGGDFNLPALSQKWEQKDYTDINWTAAYGYQEFHPCYPVLWDDRLLVGNCYGNKYITLDVESGEVLAASPNVESYYFYIDGDYVVLTDRDGATTSYLDKELNSAQPSSSDLKREDDELVLVYPYHHLYRGDDAEIASYVTYNRFAHRNEHVVAGELNYYDPDTGILHKVSSNGVDRQTQYDTKADIVTRVTKIQNDNADLNWSTSEDDVYVDHLVDGIFIVRVDTEYGYISNDFHYYVNGNDIVYLGQFYHGDWYLGADKNHVIHYSTFSYFENPEDLDVTHADHEMRQFSLENGELVNFHTETRDNLPATLYGQLHTELGIFSTSDSYSTVIRLDD